MNLYIEDTNDIEMRANQEDEIRLQAGDTINLGSSDYNDLTNKPSIDGTELVGDVSLEDIGAAAIDDLPTKVSELENDAGYITEDDIPPIPEKTSDLQNDSGFITEDDIPPLVTDLGYIDGDQYDWEIEEYLNTLQETGSYMFQWDEFKYQVDIKALEIDGITTVQQIFWDTEEGGLTIYYRNLVVEDGEIVRADTTNFLTFEEANSAFARNTHTHVRFATQSQSIWDYCNVVALSNTNPFVIYFDLSTNKTYVIETYVGTRQPLYKIQKFTEMNDPSYFCQRSSYYYSAREHWGDWFKFSGEVFTQTTGQGRSTE